MHPYPMVANAATAAAAIIRGVPADRLGAPTPCGDWDVTTVVNHLRQVLHALELAGRAGSVPGDLWERTMPRADLDGAVRSAVEAWAGRGATPTDDTRTVSMGPMDMPAPFVATMLAGDLVIHGWDLARATGQDFRCADTDAEAVLRFVRETADLGREMKIYADPVPIADTATPLDRALALSGRDPRWEPPNGSVGGRG